MPTLVRATSGTVYWSPFLNCMVDGSDIPVERRPITLTPPGTQVRGVKRPSEFIQDEAECEDECSEDEYDEDDFDQKDLDDLVEEEIRYESNEDNLQDTDSDNEAVRRSIVHIVAAELYPATCLMPRVLTAEQIDRLSRLAFQFYSTVTVTENDFRYFFVASSEFARSLDRTSVLASSPTSVIEPLEQQQLLPLLLPPLQTP